MSSLMLSANVSTSLVRNPHNAYLQTLVEADSFEITLEILESEPDS